MEKVFNEIVNRGEVPTRGDISLLLASIGEAGQSQEEKRQAVERLFVEIGHSGLNIQGEHVVESLTTYKDY